MIFFVRGLPSLTFQIIEEVQQIGLSISEETCKTILPQGPFSSCSGAFKNVTGSF